MGSKIKAALQAFWTKLNTDLADLWKTEKWFVILFGTIMLIIKFRQAIISAIVFSSKLLFESTEKKSDELQQDENKANDQANQLVDDANNTPPASTPGDDWNTK